MRVPSERFAAIDIGTVTCRMLVADVDEKGICELDREYAITNLGEGVDATGVLKPQAMERVASAIDGYLHVLETFRTSEHSRIRVITVATSAARDAKNAEGFADLLAQRGVRLSVIPGAREAALSFLGASSDFAGESIVVVDIGGGSTEVVAGRAGQNPQRSHSFNIGCRRVTERFFSADPPTSEEMACARAWIRKEMEPFFLSLRAGCKNDGAADGVASGGAGSANLRGKTNAAGAADGKTSAAGDDVGSCVAPGRLVAVAGTATSVVSIHEHMETYDSARVHKTVVSRKALDAVCGRLSALPLAERKQVVGLDPGRAPVIVAGLIILQEICDLAGANAFTVSESDILHGIILDAAGGRL